MSTITNPSRLGSPAEALGIKWTACEEHAVQCHVLLCPEEDGGYSAHALKLPGVVSQGETEQEALDNIKAAFRDTIHVYREEGMDIPWSAVEMEDRPKGSKEKWIVVNA